MIKLQLLVIFLLSTSVYASPIKVVTSITPLASIVAMIAGDKAEISSIIVNTGCPHHYTMKPSDIKQSKNADLFVYVDDKFDVFAAKLLPNISGKILHIGDLKDLKIQNSNWHLWLLPHNAVIIMRAVATMLCEISPENQELFKRNLALNISKMHELEQRRNRILRDVHHPILLSDSVEYLFVDSSSRVQKFYQHYEYLSLKAVSNLSALAQEHDVCFIVDNHHITQYRKLFDQAIAIVGISAESWNISDSLNDLYYKEYDKILDTIHSVCSTQK